MCVWARGVMSFMPVGYILISTGFLAVNQIGLTTHHQPDSGTEWLTSMEVIETVYE